MKHKFKLTRWQKIIRAAIKTERPFTPRTKE